MKKLLVLFLVVAMLSSGGAFAEKEVKLNMSVDPIDLQTMAENAQKAEDAQGKAETAQAATELARDTASTHAATALSYRDAAREYAERTAKHFATLPINVKLPPYNATGDGVTDDYVSIQSAIDAATKDGGGCDLFAAWGLRGIQTIDGKWIEYHYLR